MSRHRLRDNTEKKALYRKRVWIGAYRHKRAQKTNSRSQRSYTYLPFSRPYIPFFLQHHKKKKEKPGWRTR